MSSESPHFRTCTLCEAMCGIRIDVSNGELEVRGDEDDPFSRGHICPKASALADLHHDPDRLREPIRRVGDRWEKMPWDDALDLAAELLHGVQARHGRDAVAAYLGNPTVHNLGAVLTAPLLLKTLRSKNRFSATSVDQLPHMLAAFRMFGHQLLLPVPDVDRTDFILLLGANPLASNGSLMTAPGIDKRLAAIRARGGRVVVVDPRRTETAKAADEHVFLRPGTDALLLLAMLERVFSRGPKLGHVGAFTDGLEALAALARRFPAGRVEAHTGVPPTTVHRLADALLDTERACVYGRLGTCTQRFGGLSAWLTYALAIVTGHLDVEGGLMFTRPAIDGVGTSGGLGIGRGSFGRWKSRVRGLPEFGGELPVAALSEEIEVEGGIRGLLTFAGNPVLSTPNGARLDRALPSLEAIVSIDPYRNETSRHAHLILPPTGPLERSHYDVVFHLLAVRNTAKFSPALFERSDSQRHDWEILLGLRRRLAERREGKLSRDAVESRAFLALGPERLVDIGLRTGPYGAFRGGLSLGKLLDAPHGIDLGPLVPMLPDRLPGGRIALAPRELVEDVDRLEAWCAAKPPSLVLIGRRQLRSNNSWMHNAPRLMRGKDRCRILVHPEDARARGIAEGAPARLRSRVGEVVAPASITDEVMQGVVSLPHGFGHGRPGVVLQVAAGAPGVSANDLTDDQDVDLLSGNAVLNGVPVELEAV